LVSVIIFYYTQKSLDEAALKAEQQQQVDVESVSDVPLQTGVTNEEKTKL